MGIWVLIRAPVRAPRKIIQRGKFSDTNKTKQRYIQGLREP